MTDRFTDVTEGAGTTPASAPVFQSVPEVCALLGFLALNSLKNSGVSYAYVDDENTLQIGVDIADDILRVRLLWLLTVAGVDVG